MPASDAGSRKLRSSAPISSPVRCASVAIRQCSVSALAVEEPEDGLRVPDVGREQHRERA